MKSTNLAIVLFCLALSCSLMFANGCGGGSSNGGSTLTGIDIAPISPSVPVGGTQQFTATGHFSNGPDQDLTGNSTWTSSVTTVATVENLGTTPGLATGVSAGSSMITASFAQGSSSVSASTDLTVTAASSDKSSRMPVGTAIVAFLTMPGVSAGGLKVDGRTFGSDANLPAELPAGLHHFVSPDGRYTFGSICRRTTSIR